MKSTAKKIMLFIMSAMTVLALLCSCGSDLDGTWTSSSDSSTKIKFSGSKVKVSYGDFTMNGTYNEDEEDTSLITIDLTDEKGNKYRIEAKKKIDPNDKNKLTLVNPINGKEEVFRK